MCRGSIYHPLRLWDDWPREPDEDVMIQAYFDAKCAGDDGDFADLAYDNVYY